MFICSLTPPAPQSRIYGSQVWNSTDILALAICYLPILAPEGPGVSPLTPLHLHVLICKMGIIINTASKGIVRCNKIIPARFSLVAGTALSSPEVEVIMIINICKKEY